MWTWQEVCWGRGVWAILVAANIFLPSTWSFAHPSCIIIAHHLLRGNPYMSLIGGRAGYFCNLYTGYCLCGFASTLALSALDYQRRGQRQSRRGQTHYMWIKASDNSAEAFFTLQRPHSTSPTRSCSDFKRAHSIFERLSCLPYAELEWRSVSEGHMMWLWIKAFDQWVPFFLSHKLELSIKFIPRMMKKIVRLRGAGGFCTGWFFTARVEVPSIPDVSYMSAVHH